MSNVLPAVFLHYIHSLMMVGWSLTALSTQFRSYHAFKVEL